MRSSWSAFLAALGGAALLAVGFGVVVSRATGGDGPAPALRTVPASRVAGVGIRLGAAGQPPYCGAAQFAAGQGWVGSAGLGGCAISRAEAIDSAQAADPGTATEAVLAHVSATGPGAAPVGTDRLAWVVIVHAVPFVLPAAVCQPPLSTGPSCGGRRLPVTARQVLVVVDAATGLPVVSLTLSASAGP